jgi:DNA-binding transcriptional LysR family regulator
MLKRAQIRQFLAVVDAGSFTAAASRLYITQPTLSAGIAELERAVGAPLFVRERRALRLTDAGNRLLPHARAVEREFRQAEAAVSGASDPLQPLRLGAIVSLASQTLASIAARYAGAHPLAVEEGSDADLRRRLSDTSLDAALTLLRDGDAADTLLDEPYAMLLPRNHRFADRPVLRPEELSGETMIARRACEILAETSRFFTARGVRPRFSFRSHNDDRCLALVRAGLGITTGPASLAGDGLVAVPLEGYGFRRRIGLLVAPAAVDQVAGSGLVDAIRATL